MNATVQIDEHYRETIEAAGAEFRRVAGDSVYFRDPQTRRKLSLYLFACNSENVRLTLKNAREYVREFSELLPTDCLRF